MPDDTMLPDDDRDLLLARRLAEQLEEHAPLDHAGEDETGEDASFFRALLSFKSAQQDAHPMPADASQRVWAILEQRIAQDQPAPESRPALRLIRSLPARTWMAAAASVVLLGLVGWLLWSSAPTPVLLASAETDLVTYTAPDGSVVRLRPHSHLYALDEDDARYRLVGEGFFDVIKNEARTFKVEANEAQITVLGTRFNVSTWGNETAVFLAEGRVRFEHAGSAVVLEPGQRSLLTATSTLADPASADSAEYLDWLNGELNFAQRPLHRVLEELAYHFAVTLDVPEPMRQETVTGRLFLQDKEQSIADLAGLLEGRFVQVDDETYRFVRN